AVTDLYDHGITQSQITRIFSVGLLGTKDRRRLVPTEWSITAVDDILAKGLIDEVRGNPWTSEFEVTGASGLANNVVVLLFPGAEAELRHRLRLPLENWWRASVLRGYLRGQRRITSYA